MEGTLPITVPDGEELVSYAGLPARSDAVVFTLEKIKEAATTDLSEIRGRLLKLDQLGSIKHKMRNIDLEMNHCALKMEKQDENSRSW